MEPTIARHPDRPDLAVSKEGNQSVYWLRLGAVELPEALQAADSARGGRFRLPDVFRPWIEEQQRIMLAQGVDDRSWKDDVQRGLEVRARVSLKTGRPGGVTWYFARYYPQGKGGPLRRLRLGTLDSMTLAQARAEARRIRADRVKGEDPQARRQKNAKAWTLERAFERWHEVTATGGHLADKTRTEYARLFRSFILPRFKGRKLPDIERQEFVASVRAEALAGRVENAKYIVRAMNSIVDVAVQESGDSQLTENQFERIGKRDLGINGRARKAKLVRYFKRDELTTLWNLWTETAGDGTRSYSDRMGSIVFQIAVLTGQRSGEIYKQMRHSEIIDVMDESVGVGKIWEHARGKTGHYVVPMMPEVMELVEQAGEIKKGLGIESDLVFPAPNRPERPLTTFKEVYIKHRKLTGITDYAGHTPRRTIETWLAQTDCPEEIRDRIANHAVKGVGNQHYNAHDYLSQRVRWLTKWTQHVLSLNASVD